MGALPARFRRERVLIVGCGDVGLRVLRSLNPRVRVLALTSSPHRQDELRSAGAVPLVGNLDDARTLRYLAGLATRVLHLAPPPGDGITDPRTRALMQVLRRRSAPAGVVYGSTTGVYGNCGGAWIDETRTVHAETPRAQRRVHAEESMRFWGRSAGVSVSVLRIPGIYAQDREGGTPRGRLMRGTPVLHAQDDVYTNHINADDLARACVAALWRGKPQRVVNVNDDAAFKMGDYLDAAADLYGLPHPTRVSWDQAAKQLSPMQLSFMGESRRLCNRRMKTELRVVLRFPSVLDGLA